MAGSPSVAGVLAFDESRDGGVKRMLLRRMTGRPHLLWDERNIEHGMTTYIP